MQARRGFRSGLLRRSIQRMGLAAAGVVLLVGPAVADTVESQEAQSAVSQARFRDCQSPKCPWLIPLNMGSFVMGSPHDEAGRGEDESPRHHVVIAYRFAVSETEITREQFSAFVKATGYRIPSGCNVLNGEHWQFDKLRDWEHPGFDQSDEHPVVCINWHDAQAYASWLSRETGHVYRLLSEAEWEFAARAGTNTRYSFGEVSY